MNPIARSLRGALRLLLQGALLLQGTLLMQALTAPAAESNPNAPALVRP